MQLTALEGRVQRLEGSTTGPQCTPAGRDAGHMPLPQSVAAEGEAGSTTGWQAVRGEDRAPARPAGAQRSRVPSVVDGSARDAAAQPVSKQQQQQQQQQQLLEPLAEDLSTSDLIAQLQGRYREAFAVLQTNREALQNLGRY